MKADDKGDKMLSSFEAAAQLGVTPKTVKRMAQRGELPAQRIGTRWKFRAQDIAEYLERARVKPSAE